jgi:beta-xylosidase
VMYYSGRNGAIKGPDGKGTLCLSRALSEDPDGPFVDDSDEPLLCQPELGGTIDPTTFSDGEALYLIWKNDGNCCALPTRFWMHQLTADGLALAAGEPTDLGVVNDATWEGAVIEAPTLLKHDDEYVLLFSANGYGTHRYAVGYATSTSLEGPYEDAADNPILKNAAPAIGPGHQSVVTDDDGDLWVAYHAWDVSAIGYETGGRRAMWLDPLTFEGDSPIVHGPNASPQPIP